MATLPLTSEIIEAAKLEAERRHITLDYTRQLAKVEAIFQRVLAP